MTMLKAKDLAKELQFHPDHIKKLAREGKIPGERRGNRWFFSKEEVLKALIERNGRTRDDIISGI